MHPKKKITRPVRLQNFLFQKFGLTVITLLFIIGGISVGDYPDRQKHQGILASHSRQIINQLNMVALHITEAETGQRGFLLTQGRKDYLAPYESAVDQIQSDFINLEKLTADQPYQQDRIPGLRQNINAKLGELKKTIDLFYATGDNRKSLEMVMSDQGKNLMSEISGQISAMKTQEESVLRSRLVLWQEAAARARSAFLIGEIVLYALICSALFAFYRVSKQREKIIAAEIKASAIQKAETERLSQIVKIQREISGHASKLDDAMRIITEHTQSLTRAEGSIVEMLDGPEIVYRAASGSASPFVGFRLKAENSLSGLCMTQKKVLKCDDAQNDDRVDKAACRRIGLNSMVVVPLHYDENVFGVLKVISTNKSAFNDDDIATLELLAGFLSGTLSDALTADTLKSKNRKLEISNIDLENRANTDGLTGLKNYRVFKELLSQEYERSKRYNKVFSLILLDVDHFKTFNDSFGHPAGDAVLKTVANILQEAVRMTDSVARYGGEEFAVILPETDAEGAQIIAGRMREAIEKAPWQERQVTVSIGVSAFNNQTDGPSSLVEAADKALYASKELGRNRVTLA